MKTGINLPKIITIIGIALVVFAVGGMWCNAVHDFGPRCVDAFTNTIAIGALVMLILFLVWLIGELNESTKSDD
jgi:uncharacterized membrane protein